MSTASESPIQGTDAAIALTTTMSTCLQHWVRQVANQCDCSYAGGDVPHQRRAMIAPDHLA